MNKLIKANFMIMFKSKVFYCFLVGFVLLRLIPDLFTCLFGSDETIILSEIPFNPFGNVCFFIPLFSAAFSGLMISPQFEQGVVRNKLVTGHKRADIYLADMIVTIIAVLMFFVVYEMIGFVFGLCFFDTSAFSAKIILEQFLFLLVIFIGNLLFSISICFIVKNSKSTVLAFMFQYVLLFGMIFEEMGGELAKIGEFVCRFSPMGLTLTNEMPEKFWLNIICVGLLGLFMTALSMWDFNKCDIK